MPAHTHTHMPPDPTAFLARKLARRIRKLVLTVVSLCHLVVSVFGHRSHLWPTPWPRERFSESCSACCGEAWLARKEWGGESPEDLEKTATINMLAACCDAFDVDLRRYWSHMEARGLPKYVPHPCPEQAPLAFAHASTLRMDSLFNVRV